MDFHNILPLWEIDNFQYNQFEGSSDLYYEDDNQRFIAISIPCNPIYYFVYILNQEECGMIEEELREFVRSKSVELRKLTSSVSSLLRQGHLDHNRNIVNNIVDTCRIFKEYNPNTIVHVDEFGLVKLETDNDGDSFLFVNNGIKYVLSNYESAKRVFDMLKQDVVEFAENY